MNIPVSFRKLALSVSLFALGSLVACGGDSSSSKDDSKPDSGVDQVATFDDLVHCTKSHYDEIYLVEDEDVHYKCTSDGWQKLSDEEVEEHLSSAANDGKSSSSSKDSTETPEIKDSVVKVDTVVLRGYAQKGPFLKGSAMTLSSIQIDLKEVKTKVSGKTEGDSGAYLLKATSLSSQFAAVNVSGFYRDEITGKNTSGTKTSLTALAILGGDTTAVNVNVLTQLEYMRALSLAKSKGVSLKEAKVQATEEIFEVIGGSDYQKYANDKELAATAISLADTGKAGALLTSASVAFTLNQSAGKLAKRLAALGDDFASEGCLSDTLAASIADELNTQDSIDGFKAVRENLTAMRLSSKVPDFESILQNFWTKVYGLGECTDELETEIKTNTNKLSERYEVGFACTGKAWHRTTDIDTELGLCLTSKEGTTSRTKKDVLYLCKGGKWLKAGDLENEIGFCLEKNNGDTARTKKDVLYKCKDGIWDKANDVEQELGYCTSKLESVVDTLSSSIYRCADGEWIEGNDSENEVGLFCLEKNDQDTVRSEKGVLYTCLDKVWEKAGDVEQTAGFCDDKRVNETVTVGGRSYICRNENWESANGAETSLGFCLAENEGEVGAIDSTYYICSKKSWTEITQLEYNLGGVCSESAAETFGKSGSKYYYCNGNEWTKIDEQDYIAGAFCDSSTIKSMSKNGSSYYWCDGKNWLVVDSLSYLLGSACLSSTTEKTAALFLEMSSYTDGNGKVNTYVCKRTATSDASIQYSWSKATDNEVLLGKSCNYYSANNRTVAFTAKGAAYVCDVSYNFSGDWRVATDGEKETKKICSRDILGVRNGAWYCDSTRIKDASKILGYYSNYAWRELTDLEILMDSTVCDSNYQNLSSVKDRIVYKNGTGYVCTNVYLYPAIHRGGHNNDYQWRTLTEPERMFGDLCAAAHVGKYVGPYECK